MVFTKIFKAIKFSKLWNKALDRSSEGNSSEAIDEINKIRNLFKNKIDKLPYFVNVLHGYLLGIDGKHSQSIDIFTTAKEQINSESSLNSTNRRYLEHYCNWGILYSAKKIGKLDEFSNLKNFQWFDETKLRKVRSDLRKKFPIRQPDW